MPLMICPKCERFHYVPGECLVPKSTGPHPAGVQPATEGASSILAPVDTKPKPSRKADRHPPGYQAQKQREYRERKKAKT